MIELNWEIVILISNITLLHSIKINYVDVGILSITILMDPHSNYYGQSGMPFKIFDLLLF